ncbi:MAG: hypothetical protein GY807_24325 [Gammaproteobacteria bacterium]|nr:hypothetical protein [Gammaproteobacteria bacterium]
MEFNFIKKCSLPKSAWAAHMRRNEPTIDVYHGTSVETQNGFFVEGAWDGEYHIGEFDEAITLLGSGGRLLDVGTVVFASPSHIFDRLYSLAKVDRLYISNSLAFLLSISGEALDKEYQSYPDILYRKYGVGKENSKIPTQSQNFIRLFYYTNAIVSLDLKIDEQSKHGAETFINYASYIHFLESTVARVFNNASAPQRGVAYNRLVVALSTGYDSTATSVFAKHVGCKEAVTFKEARPMDVAQFNPGEDNGTCIATAMGMSCQEFGRLDYLLSRQEFPEGEILATSHFVDLYALSLETYLTDRTILFTGFRGDQMWDKEEGTAQDYGGPGLAEFRLRKGFLHFPLPYLGTRNVQPDKCEVSQSVRRISNSEEMVPWSIGGDYDRPIPRRIAESAGIDRNLFGMSKKAVAVWYGKEDIMTSASYQDLQTFRARAKGSEANQAFLWGMDKIKNRYCL